jgi:hypothetical protein
MLQQEQTVRTEWKIGSLYPCSSNKNAIFMLFFPEPIINSQNFIRNVSISESLTFSKKYVSIFWVLVENVPHILEPQVTIGLNMSTLYNIMALCLVFYPTALSVFTFCFWISNFFDLSITEET